MITSTSNPRIRQLIALQEKAKKRREENCFLAEGIKMLREAPESWIREIFLTNEALYKLQKEEAETMIANGMEELSSRDELSAAVGFPVKAAMSLPFFPQEIHYTSYWGDMAQTDYANGSAGACLRQSVGTEDHSGDWNEYPAQQTITAAGCTVTLKGETGSYTLAIWTDGNYSYSLSLSSGQPESVWQTIIEGVQ